MMTQKGDLYNKLFNILSALKLISCIMSQIKILCSSLVKRYYT